MIAGTVIVVQHLQEYSSTLVQSSVWLWEKHIVDVLAHLGFFSTTAEFVRIPCCPLNVRSASSQIIPQRGLIERPHCGMMLVFKCRRTLP